MAPYFFVLMRTLVSMCMALFALMCHAPGALIYRCIASLASVHFRIDLYALVPMHIHPMSIGVCMHACVCTEADLHGCMCIGACGYESMQISTCIRELNAHRCLSHQEKSVYSSAYGRMRIGANPHGPTRT